MNTPTYNIIVIGAGIVGSALARALTQRFDGVLLLEKEPSAGLHTSGRNSGVVHSGFNPKPGTLKAKLCVEGNAMIRRYCQEKAVPCEQVGTCVIADREEQVPGLSELKKRGDQNGVPGLVLLSQRELQGIEPNALGLAALFSPTGSIVDAKALTQSLAQDAQEKGVTLRTNEGATDLQEIPDGIRVKTREAVYTGKLAINCGGLHADRLAHRMGVGFRYMIAPFRGEYFMVRRPLVRSMVYAPPDPRFPFLGIHLTRTMAGGVLVGPNAVPAFGREAYGKNDFCFNDMVEMMKHKGFWNALLHNRGLVRVGWKELRHSLSKTHFLQEANRLVRGLSLEDLNTTSHVGIRPQLIRDNGELVEDMVIEKTPHSIHILNVVSPGMTCSLAFAKWMIDRIDDQLRWTEKDLSASVAP